MTMLRTQALNNYENDLKIAWFLSLQGHIFKFLYTTKTTRKNFFYSENNYFQSPHIFRPSEPENAYTTDFIKWKSQSKILATLIDLLIQESLNQFISQLICIFTDYFAEFFFTSLLLSLYDLSS